MSDDVRAGSVNTNTLTANVDGVGTLAGLDGAATDTLVVTDGDRRVTIDAADGGVRVEVSDDE